MEEVTKETVAAENTEAADQVARAVKESASANSVAVETAAENAEATETMEDLKDAIDASFREEEEDGTPVSEKEEPDASAWEVMRNAMKKKTPVDVKITEAVKAGVLCHPEGLRGFIPASKLSTGFVEEKDLPSYVGKTVKAQVVTCDQSGKKLVLSVRDVLRVQADKERAEKIAAIKPDTVADGKVVSLTNFGAFVDLGDGVEGLVHVSQISDKRIDHPGAVLKVGQAVKVKVLAVKDGKLSLSMKALNEKIVEEDVKDFGDYKAEGALTTTMGDLIRKAMEKGSSK